MILRGIVLILDILNKLLDIVRINDLLKGCIQMMLPKWDISIQV